MSRLSKGFKLIFLFQVIDANIRMSVLMMKTVVVTENALMLKLPQPQESNASVNTVSLELVVQKVKS